MPAPVDCAHEHRGNAYVAAIVSEERISHFVHSGGGGDRAVAWVASQQLGVITAHQLHLAGLGRGALPSRRARGLLRPLFRGIYQIGPAPPLPGAWELAGVLVCGPQAVVSHRSAAVLWGIAEPAEEVDVSVCGRHCRSRQGLRVHEVAELTPIDRRARKGIPLTAPDRTLIDFAAQGSRSDLERALSEAYAQRLVTERQLRAAIDSSPRRAGVKALRALLDSLDGPTITRSEAERRLLRLITDADLPRPVSNAWVAGHEVDCVWPSSGLILEVDGFAFHGHRGAFEHDRRRDASLVAAGYRVIRVTWRQLAEQPLALVATLAAALGARATDNRPQG
jgi:very-short-patch-repair endonuclease